MLKKALILIFLITFNLIYVGCTTDKVDYLTNPIGIVYKNQVPYIINDKNELFSLEAYDTVAPFFDDFLIVKKNNLYGYIKSSGEVLTECIYKEAYPFSEGKAVIKSDNVYQIINTNLDILYTLDENISSSASFNNNNLVVNVKNNNISYYTYLTHNSDNTFFIHTELSFDYCGNFVNNMAKVGKYDENNILKYTFINDNFITISDFIWDEVSDFSEGYAKVCKYQEYKALVYCGNMHKFDETARATTTINTYYYINENSEFISSNGLTTNISEASVFAMGNDFTDGIALVANLYFYAPKYDDERWNGINYDYSTNKFFYNYDFIKIDGTSLITSDISIQNNWGGATSMYNDLVKVGDYYVTTYYNASWRLQYLNFSSSNGFLDMTWDVDTISSNDELVNYPWINTFIDNFAKPGSTYVFVADKVTNPYTISHIKKSKHINNQYVFKTQIFTGSNNSSGLVTITCENNQLLLSYVIPPLYDDVIF